MITSELAERLSVLGAHLDDEREARALRTIGPASGATDRPAAELDLPPVRSGVSGRVLAAVAAVVIGVGAGWAATARPDGPSVVATSVPPAQGSPDGTPSSAPASGSLAAYVDDPPAWFGEPAAGMSDGGDRTGRWSSAVVGIRFGDTVLSPVLLSVTDGTARALDDAETIDRHGQQLRSVNVGGWQTLATVGSPYVVASGAVGEDVLAELLRLVEVSAEPSGFSFEIGELPDRYTLIQPPRLLASSPAQRHTFTNSFADVSINDVSEWGDAELAAAATGVTYRHVTVGRLTGWAGQSDLNSFGPLSFFTWSPEPGIVLEITTSNPDRTIDDLAELAAKTRAVPVETWTQLMEAE